MSLDTILNFPIKTAFLNLLVDNYLNKRCGVKTIDGALVINTDYDHFDMIVAIYNDPKLPLTSILEFNKISEFLEADPRRHRLYGTPTNMDKPIFVEDTIYQSFIEELSFYGIETLFQLNLDTSQATLVAKCETRLKSVFGDRYDEFRRTVARLGGYLSGSFILQVILGETWDQSDLDVYVNSHLITGLVQKEFTWVNHGLSIPKYKVDTDGISKYLMDLFSCTEYTIHTQQEMDNGYGLCLKLSHVIKFTFSGIKIDLVVVDCTVPFFIGQFDFDFNRVYYDLYTVYAFDWDAIRNKKTVNRYARSRYNISETNKYFDNMSRIQKYIARGFVVTKYADTTWELPILTDPEPVVVPPMSLFQW
jgi:hypothetical protein